MRKFRLLRRIDYIGTGETLPPPLEPEEEEYYLKKLKRMNPSRPS